MKTKIIPFNLETAKKIQAGEIEGKIKTYNDEDVRIICTDKASTDDGTKTQIVCLIRQGARELVSIHDPNTGQCWDIEDGKAQHLVLEVPDNEPQFKPFDKVLVRNSNSECWLPRLYSRKCKKIGHWAQDGDMYEQCIPYEGNEHLFGTTDEPKEE